MTTTDAWADRVESGDWTAITDEVNGYGGALLPQLLTPDEAAEIRALYDDTGAVFRSTVDMGRHRSGKAGTGTSRRPTPSRSNGSSRRSTPRLVR